MNNALCSYYVQLSATLREKLRTTVDTSCVFLSKVTSYMRARRRYTLTIVSPATLVTSTNSVLFPFYNGELTFEHTFLLPTFANMLLGQFPGTFLMFEGNNADV